ncbi:hypothetical protein METBIDRAFT_38248 [Metschnikowia bicuspidata var. bicuspidata NRRL YB-4993]|uniref:Uncharacterized protein n=1 Tax=Metschnikowia bicuspidata var. bicuspidata NRRL YB-4993 TaxID=869754 RepID=A0A1A0HFH2_9ASCO|nr:hypothetical protein METBIDRAFT_38248 [Metschnikowia bicuspidata var. bicuspidata NRRL YB-4993]OBA22735.1 hypothetical protein METBIDRAFT_38248 [Metschnikowia bicuspidata var. bicuspidata NRRL YB-4993]
MEYQEYVIASGFMGMSLKAFVSENALRMFQEYCKISKKHQDFSRAKDNQNRSVGLPLFTAKRSIRMGLGDTTYLHFFECASAPEATDRLYDKVDNRPIGEVLRRKYIGYYRYRLQIKGVEIVIIVHSRLPIVDFNIDNERFRFVKAVNSAMNPDHFIYDLYLLTPDQASLVDDLNSSLKVRKDNPLLGGRLHNLFLVKLGSHDRSFYLSPHRRGTFEHHLSWKVFKKTKKCSMFTLYNYATGEPDSNDGVDFHTRVLVAITLILQAYEDDLQSSRAAVN